MADSPRFPPLDDASAALLTPHLKGISSVTLRFVGKDPMLEGALRGFLQQRGILVDVTHVGQIVPPPLRRFSFQYHGRSAVLTVSPPAGLKG